MGHPQPTIFALSCHFNIKIHDKLESCFVPFIHLQRYANVYKINSIFQKMRDVFFSLSFALLTYIIVFLVFEKKNGNSVRICQEEDGKLRAAFM